MSQIGGLNLTKSLYVGDLKIVHSSATYAATSQSWNLVIAYEAYILGIIERTG